MNTTTFFNHQSQFLGGRVLTLLILLIILAFGGGIGYYLIETEWSFLDSMYMAVITVTTVGYKEVHDLSSAGKIYTMFLAVVGLGFFGFIVTNITGAIMNMRTTKFEEIRLKTKIKKMKNHVIICGLGRNGRQTVKELLGYGEKVIIIEKDESLSKIYKDDSNVLFINGDATEDEVLLQAGVMQAKALVATMPIDSENLFVVVSARSLNQDLKIICRASKEASVKKIKNAGADSVVMPELLGGAHMAELVSRSEIIEFLQHLHIHSDMPTNLEIIFCSKLRKNTKTIGQIAAREKTGINIIGIQSEYGEFIMNPGSDTVITEKCKLYVLGTHEQVIKFKNIF